MRRSLITESAMPGSPLHFPLSSPPASLLRKSSSPWGEMKVTMGGMLAGCVTNIILDPVLIFGIGPFTAMSIEGAALATGIGQVLTVVIYLVIYLRARCRCGLEEST